jgi:hypothetical protein
LLMTLQLAPPPADEILKTTPSTSLMPPPALPVGVQLEAAFSRGKVIGKAEAKGKEMGKEGKSVVQGKGKGKVQGAVGRGDDEHSDVEHIDQADDDNDTSCKDNYGLSAECIVQQVS